jgi:hypothetical protein
MSKWSTPQGKKEEFKLAAETAEAQVREILEFYKLDVEDISDEKSRSAFESSLNKLQTAFRRGQLEVKREEGRFKIVQHLSSATGNDLTYDELRGSYKPVMDGYGTDAMYKRQYALLGALCGLGEKAIESLHGIDLSVAECLGFLFLMV